MTDQRLPADPLAPATPVDDPEISEIVDLRSGAILNVREFIASHRYDAFIETRGQIRERLNTDERMFACALCGTPAYVVAQAEDRRFFFRHIHEDGSCRAHTRGELSQDEIRARQYHGQRESAAHKRIKSLIDQSLSADSSFHTIQQEQIWRAARDPKSRRQPDVQAVSASVGRVAFEVQLSTTFLNVVVDRRAFYRREGALLVWVLGHVPSEFRRLMIDDLLFSNNSNIFVVDDETTRVSKTRGAFHMRCFYRVPVREGFEIANEWREAIVAFSELKCSVETQTAYYFDYAAEEARLRVTIAAERDVASARLDDEFRREFFALWQAAEQINDTNPSLQSRWRSLVSTLLARGVEIPPRGPLGDSGFRAMLIGVLSAEAGAPVGWEFQSLIQVANRLFDGHKKQLLAFGFAVRHFDRDELLDNQDKKGKWAARKLEIKNALKERNPIYIPDDRWVPALEFLMPAIGNRVRAFLTRSARDLSGEIL